MSLKLEEVVSSCATAGMASALLSRIQYSPEARQKFVDYLGDEAKVGAIEAALQSASAGTTHEKLSPFTPGLGALDPEQANEGQNSQAERDSLIREIQSLRSSGTDAEAEQKASKLRELLKQR
jgi:ATP phosphoribosyltransferase regulatory subunit HisZ